MPVIEFEGGRLFEVNGVKSIIMNFVDGSDLTKIKRRLTFEEIDWILEQTVKIQNTKIENVAIYDSWGIVNFPVELDKLKQKINAGEFEVDPKIIDYLDEMRESHSVFDKLPKAFIHADLIAPNIMMDKSGQMFFIDFSVAQFYPRIIEYAVLLCQTLNGYEDCVLHKLESILTEEELNFLPNAINFAHAMHIIGGVKESKHNPEEAKEYLDIGLKGLGLV